MSEEHAYAYEAGYRDGSINYELEHCPACKNVADLQEALAENAKLRESVRRLMTQRDGRLARAEAENAKLRELARTFYHCTTSGECDECPINGGGPVHLMPDTICDTIHDRMGELGVDA